ncbi:hypothetical protein VM1G_11375 [Cytospora mali]|uniref:Uncharacterized protein n=1 Tax=Cytospora mali TaxID=578113 RepID=A0A194VNP3_CYTMA|nr:hypothetical protein VM1G_11375 [Valsa mali]
MSSPATAQPPRDALPKLSAIYHVVVTPIIFVSFLVSLAWVEFQNSLRRSHNHAEEPSGLPLWLHRIVYRQTPYKYVKANASEPRAPVQTDEGTRWYYHSKQRKLMKMEADDAFKIRSTVLVVLALLTVATLWALRWVVWWVWIAAATKLS